MQSLLFILAAVVALLTPGFSWSFPGTFPIVRRESIEPGSPLYECHANCGGVILIYQDSDDYCSNSTYKSELSACLKCALTYNIWQYYGDDVKSAAEACGDSATPSASSATGAAATATAASNSSATNTGNMATITSTATRSSSASSAASTSGANTLLGSKALVLVLAAAAGVGALM
ncbi:cytochrome P450 family protein [Aspergillus tubingensis]|uniref:cytochrome P450 family protein n=1 Tax=Aspergillus tubingensis TaxID=5068 RepID=UPI001579BB6D|nr:cytochrome P450 family protein [Aspergillus tubingensis]GFN19465.1 cytochrome P450 family protein [Aspergillus tubingensis]GLA92140.1 hypothetical protein AtubIFM57143_006803 [Aspergillus tubingensis]